MKLRLLLIVGIIQGVAFAGLIQETINFTEVDSLIVAAPPLPAIDNSPFLTPAGVGFDGVAGLIVHRSDGTFICTGSLIAPDWILTAGHCLANNSGVNVTSSVDATFFPSGGGQITLTASGAANLQINPLYNGATISDNDLAMIHLPSAPAGVEVYSLYMGPPTNQPYTVVGYGQRGDGANGEILPGGSRRRGFNTFDFFNSPGVLISDFDNGLAANDASCIVAGICNLGLGALESSTAHGDSGGPVFFGNQIVAITSFGATAGNPPDIDSALNSSFGEFNGFVSVGFNARFIEADVSPEPGTWSLLLIGTGAILGFGIRSRRSRS